MINTHATESAMKADTTKIVLAPLAALAAFLAAGCQKPPPPPPPPPPPAWHIPADRSSQIQELSRQASVLDQQVQQLPGGSQAEHQRTASAAYSALGKAIRLANGSNPSPELQNRLQLIYDAQALLTQPQLPPARLAASENEATRAAIDSLEQIANKQLSDDEKIPPLIETARAKLGGMYTTVGPMHDLAARDTLAAVSDLLHRISDDFNHHQTS